MQASDKIILEAESLPVEERLKVVDSLLLSLNPPDPEIDQQWIAEARRLDEIRSGKVQPVSGTHVIQRLRECFPGPGADLGIGAPRAWRVDVPREN